MRTRLLSHDMVDIYVSPESTHWILHSKLLCHRSPFFRRIFNPSKADMKALAAENPNYQQPSAAPKNSRFGLPDTPDEPFKLFVGWLYSDSLPAIADENELSDLLELYMLAEKWEVGKLIRDILDSVRRWYRETGSWPSLRRVQFVYENTSRDSPMRFLMVGCIARMLTVEGKGEGVGGIPKHWEAALRRNGELAVDLILTVRSWALPADAVPDAREESVDPIVERAEERKEERKSVGDHISEDNKADEGIGRVEDVKLPNGVSHSESE